MSTPAAVSMPFGRHKGRAVALLVQAERHYCFWLMGQPFVRDKYPAVYSALRRGIVKQLTAELQDENEQAEFAARRAADPAGNRFEFIQAGEYCKDLV